MGDRQRRARLAALVSKKRLEMKDDSPGSSCKSISTDEDMGCDVAVGYIGRRPYLRYGCGRGARARYGPRDIVRYLPRTRITRMVELSQPLDMKIARAIPSGDPERRLRR